MNQALFNALPSFARGSEPWKAKPFSVKVDGRITWSVATDGAWLIAVKGGSLKPPDEPKPQVVEIISSKAVEPSYEVEVSRLREWVGEPPDVWEFDLDEQDQGIIFNVVLDRRRLACLLSKIPFETVRIWCSTEPVGVRSITMDAQDWRAVLAGVDRNPEDPVDEGEEPIPVFVLKPKSVFEMAMALGEDP